MLSLFFITYAAEFNEPHQLTLFDENLTQPQINSVQQNQNPPQQNIPLFSTISEMLEVITCGPTITGMLYDNLGGETIARILFQCFNNSSDEKEHHEKYD